MGARFAATQVTRVGVAKPALPLRVVLNRQIARTVMPYSLAVAARRRSSAARPSCTAPSTASRSSRSRIITALCSCSARAVRAFASPMRSADSRSPLCQDE